MRHRRSLSSARVGIALLAASVLTACSDESPTKPSALSAAPGGSAAGVGQAAQSVAGLYTLSFFARVNGAYQEVTSLPVQTAELILRADVTDSAGAPASSGAVAFEYCSYGKGPRRDITRADEAPKEECEQGTAKWVRLGSRSVGSDPNCFVIGGGSACYVFGIVRIPRTIGFRFRFSQKQGTIASGISEAKNFTWIAGS